MKNRKLSDTLFIIVFALFMLGILTTTILRPKEETSSFESRNLADHPEITLDTVMDGSFFQSLESFLCDNGAFRTTILKIKAWTEINLLRRPVVNDVLVTEDILVSYNEYEYVDEEKISAQAEGEANELEKLNSLVESYGGYFVYVAIPAHYTYYEELYPSWLNNKSEYTECQKSAFFNALSERGVPYLDIGEAWESEGHPMDYMSATDHHYTLKGCFSAYRALSDVLRSEVGITMLTEDDFNVNTFQNPFSGSRYRRLCGQWRHDEQLDYALLKIDIPFTRYNYGNTTPGSSITVHMPENPWAEVAYTAYMGGDISETIIKTERPSLPNCLIFGDSYTNPMEGLLYGNFNEMRSLDLRYYKEQSLINYVDQYRPEVVVCIRDYDQLISMHGNGKIS